MRRPPLAGPLSWTLARRLLRDPASPLLHSSARAALLASTLGVAALGIAMALMTGYQEDLVRKLVGANAAILVDARALEEGAAANSEPGAAAASLVAAIRSVPGVVRVDRARYVQGVISSAAGEAEVTLRAVPPGAGAVAPDAADAERRPDGAWGVRLGSRLAERLGVAAGDPVRLAALTTGDDRPRFAFRRLDVTGTFTSGFSEFDSGWAAVSPAAIADLPGVAKSLLEVTVTDPAAARAVAEGIRAKLGPEALVVPWQESYRTLFAALDLQRRALFLLLCLIVVVATFNVASTLVVLVRERMRDLGVLASLGVTPAGLRRVFLIYGGVLGAAGTALGLGLAFAVSWLFTRFEVLSFGPDISAVYFLSSVPLRLAGGDALAIAGFALVVTLAACWLPAWRASRLDPATALRYE
jgi:lipoprotein-releasing system permease protein